MLSAAAGSRIYAKCTVVLNPRLALSSNIVLKSHDRIYFFMRGLRGYIARVGES